MNRKTTVLAIAIAIAAIPFITIQTQTSFADKESGQQGVDRADQAIHDHQGPNSKTDQNFHKGTCSGGFGAGGFQC